MRSKLREFVLVCQSIVQASAWIFIALIIGACAPALPIESPPITGAPTTEVGSTPSIVPTPAHDIQLEESMFIRSADSDEWQLIGVLSNRESYLVGEIEVTLTIADGQVQYKMQPGGIVPEFIPPSGRALFQIRLDPFGEPPTDFSIDVNGERLDEQAIEPVLLTIEQQRSLPDGRLELLGIVENLGDHLLHMHAIQILLLDPEGTPLDIAFGDHMLSALPPQASVPFTAWVAHSVEFEAYEGFVSATPELLPPSPPFRFGQPLRIEETHQGGFLFLGEVENEGVTPWWLELELVYKNQDEIIGLDSIQMPRPLFPGETMPFVIDPTAALPVELLAKLAADEIDVDLHINHWDSLPTLITWEPLPVTITQFEQIGRRLYMRGVVSNTSDQVLTQTSVILQVLDVFGRTRSVGWLSLSEALGPGEELRYTIDMVLPKDLNLNAAEFDLRAYGTKEGG